MTDPRGQDGSTPRTTDSRARTEGDCELARAVAMCAADAGFLAGIEQILLQADRAAGEQRFECRQCGECCRFEQFGHRLHVTAGELALMLKFAPDRVPEPIGKIRPWGIFDNPQSLGDRSAIKISDSAK